MPLKLITPIIYLITSGETTPQTTPASEDFSRLLKVIKAAVAGGVDLLQLREKNLNTRVLFELTAQAAEITRGSSTRLLVNDRADVARAAGAHGVHLATRSLETSVVRKTFGDQLLIGVSAHSLEEVKAARDSGANFAVFGPVFETATKQVYGEPQGVEKLAQVTGELAPFPVLALGGITLDNAGDCFRAGASGVAAIRVLNKTDKLGQVVAEIRAKFQEQER
ncbi:MAG: thiamine phosphate synthase [Pyrinomonadaceae bacterium]